MKKGFLISLAVLLAAAVSAQDNRIVRTIKIKDSLELRGKWYKTFKNRSYFDIVLDGGADTTGAIDVSGIVQSAISAGVRNIFFPKGNFKVANTIYLKDSTLIHGSGAASSISIFGNINAFHLRKIGGNYAQIKNIAFNGTMNLPTNIYSYGIQTDGGQTAILIDTAIGVMVSEVYAKNVNGYAIKLIANSINNIASAYVQDGPRGNEVINCHVTRSFGGVLLTSGAEYNRILGGSYNNNYIAHKQYLSGNNLVSNVNMSGNIFGAIVEGSSPWYTSNNGHGTMTGCAINHNRTGLWFKDVSWGYYLSNNMLYNDWDSVKFENCDRIVIEGGYITVNNGAKFYINNCTKFTMDNVSDLLGIATSYAVVGELPTIIKQDIVPGALSWFDPKTNKTFSIKHENGLVTTTGDESVKFASEIGTSQPTANGAGFWKLGKKVTATVGLVTTDYIEVEIDGVVYKLGLVN